MGGDPAEPFWEGPSPVEPGLLFSMGPDVAVGRNGSLVMSEGLLLDQVGRIGPTCGSGNLRMNMYV